MPKACDIFQKISERQITGMMLHEQLADYYDFLNLRGFKRLHEYRFFCEAAEMRGIHRYYINHFNMLVLGSHPGNPSAIPDGWSNYTRQQVTQDVKRRSVRDGMGRWISWERESKKFYERCYSELCEIGEIAAAQKAKALACNVDQELKYADRLCLDMEGTGYDLTYIVMMQDDLHDHYEAKTKEIGVNIC